MESAKIEEERILNNPILENAHFIHSHRRPAAFRVGKLIGFMLVVSMSATLFTVSTTASSSGLSTAAPAPHKVLTLPNPSPQPDRGSGTLSEVPTVVVEPPPGPSPALAVHISIKHVEATPVAPSRIEIAIGYALAQRGKPYRWNGAGPNSFDCSGLVMMAERAAGYNLPHYTGTMMGYGHRVSRSQLQRGDIIFPSDHHVGLYLGGGMMIVAPHSGTVVQIQHVYAFYTAIRL